VPVDTQLTDLGFEVPGQPLPRPHLGVQSEPADHPLSGADGHFAQAPGQSCWSRQPSDIASNTPRAASDPGDRDAANHIPLDLLMDFPSCPVLDAGFNQQMQSNPEMPTSEHENGHHQLPAAEHGHGVNVQAQGLITSPAEHAFNRICGRSPLTQARWDTD